MPDPDVLFTEVKGVFYRAVDPDYRAYALSGSRSPGRYSSIAQPALYLSSSPDGVAAAMQSHKADRSDKLDLIRVQVAASRICDLRNARALAAMGVSLEDALAPWREIVARGGTPRSWRVRDRLESFGAHGLIDPSRTAPGLWHLVLFSWNHDGAPQVHLID